MMNVGDHRLHVLHNHDLDDLHVSKSDSVLDMKS